MIELLPLQIARQTGGGTVGGSPGLPADEESPPPSARSSSILHTADTIEVSGQALEIAASSGEKNSGYNGEAIYSGNGQPLAATGGLLDITG